MLAVVIVPSLWHFVIVLTLANPSANPHRLFQPQAWVIPARHTFLGSCHLFVFTCVGCVFNKELQRITFYWLLGGWISVPVTPQSLIRCENSSLIIGFICRWSLFPLLPFVYNDDDTIFHCHSLPFSSLWKWVISHRELFLAALWGPSKPTFALCGYIYAVPQLASYLLIDALLMYYLPSTEHVFECGDTGGEGSSRTRNHTVINRQATHPWAHPTPRFPCRYCWLSMPRLTLRAGRMSHVFWEDFMARLQILQAKEPNITTYSRL